MAAALTNDSGSHKPGLLEPGGVLRICVPILNRPTPEKIRDICCNHGQQQIYSEDSPWLFLKRAGFDTIDPTERKEIDAHWRDIGVEFDNLETLRLEAAK